MEIKMLVFDQDGTLYSNSHELFLYTRVKTKEWLSKKLNKPLIEINNIYDKLPNKFPNPYIGFNSLGCTTKEYMSEVFDKINPKKFIDFNPRLYKFFENEPLLKALVTLASPKYTEELQEKLRLKNFYDKILYVKDFKSYNKKACYQKLAKDFNIEFPQICVIGDSYVNDILPAQELGCKTIFISESEQTFVNTKKVKNIEEFIENGGVYGYYK